MVTEAAVEYSDDGNVAFYDGYKFNRDKKTGYFLSTRKTDLGRQERLHAYVWRKHNGKPEQGYQVHHIDGDKNNNEIENLICVSGSIHSNYHANQYAAGHKREMLDNLDRNARPKAAEWHRSEAGREWHRLHGIKTMENRKLLDFVCEQCGKPFQSKKAGSRFCCNACKSQWRRDAGIDNVIRVCAICGDKFTTNKYSKAQTCSSLCSRKLLCGYKQGKGA